MSEEVLVGAVLCHVVYPHTVGGHGLAEAQLDLHGADLLPIHGLQGPHHRLDVVVLHEPVGCGALLVLDINVL